MPEMFTSFIMAYRAPVAIVIDEICWGCARSLHVLIREMCHMQRHSCGSDGLSAPLCSVEIVRFFSVYF